MPSSFGHAVAGLAVASALRPTVAPRRYWVAATLCATLVDLDALPRVFGSGLEARWGGHRGVTHSIAFALLLGAAVVWIWFRDARWNGSRGRLWAAFALATATHGLLDALTTRRPPIAFFWPFSWQRYTFAWHPIDPSLGPGGPGGIFTVLANELFWVGVLSLPIATVSLFRTAERPSDSVLSD